MSITLGDAVLWIRGKSEKLQGDLDKSGKQVEGWANKIKTQLGESMNFAVGQIMSEGISQLAAGIENMTRETINLGMEYARQVEDMARLSGASVKDASRIIQVADDMRVSYEDVSTALKMYAKTQSDAGQVAEMSIDELARLSDRYLQLAPGVERANFLLENFGKAGLNMGKLMGKGGDSIREMSGAVDESLIMSQDGIDKAREYEVALDNWNDSIMGIKIGLSQALLPALTSFASFATDTLIPIIRDIANWFTELPAPIQNTVIRAGGLVFIISKLGPALLGIVGILGMFKGGAAAAGTAAAAGAAKTGLLAGAFASLKAALLGVGAFLAGISAPVWLLIAAIGALIAVIVIFGKDALNTARMFSQIWHASLTRVNYEILRFVTILASTFKRAYNVAVEAGKSIPEGILAGVKASWNLLLDGVAMSLDSLLKFVRKKLGIKSPSQLFADMLGAPMAQGIGAGFDQTVRQEVTATVAAGTGALAAGAGRSMNIKVGHIENHGRFSQSEMDFFDQRQERIVENTLLAALGGAL